MIEKTITIRCNEVVWAKLMYFFALLHHNGGHSGVFGLAFDGDGNDRLTIDPEPAMALRNEFNSTTTTDDLRHMVGLSGDVGHELEYASESGYTIAAINRERSIYRATRNGLFRLNPHTDRYELRKR